MPDYKGQSAQGPDAKKIRITTIKQNNEPGSTAIKKTKSTGIGLSSIGDFYKLIRVKNKFQNNSSSEGVINTWKLYSNTLGNTGEEGIKFRIKSIKQDDSLSGASHYTLKGGMPDTVTTLTVTAM